MTRDSDTFRIRRAGEHDLETLMTWFDGEDDVVVWGGPKFRYPFDATSFRADAHFDDMATFALDDSSGRFCAFGQMYNRNDHINLARLIVDPARRGSGIGRTLMLLLMEEAPALFDLERFSLFVFRNNKSALGLYRSLGFEIQEYLQDQILADECYFLTRSAR